MGTRMLISKDELSKRLRIFRVINDLSQQQVADAFEMDLRSYQRYEEKVSAPRFNKFGHIVMIYMGILLPEEIQGLDIITRIHDRSSEKLKIAKSKLGRPLARRYRNE